MVDINTCLATTEAYHTIAYYSHVIPVLITLLISGFVLRQSKYSVLAQSFTLFTVAFSLWLIGDLITWTASDYDLVAAAWAPLDYLNIVFYLLAAYFFTILARGKDLSILSKILLFSIAIPGWWLTISNRSTTDFYQPACELLSPDSLAMYKFFLEGLTIAYILFVAVIESFKSIRKRRAQISIVAVGLVLFLGVFSISEYLSTQTGIYEITLYSLFVLPIFLFIILYAISSLEIFNIRLVGFQILPYILVILVGSQFFFLDNTTDRNLTLVTFFTCVAFAGLLINSGKREILTRKRIEKLAHDLEGANNQLKELDREKDELLGIVAHQLAKPITAVRWDLESMLDGDLGILNDQQKNEVEIMKSQAINLADLVSMILDVSRIQLGKIRLEPQPLNLQNLFREMLDVIHPTIIDKKIKFEAQLPPILPIALLDKRYTRMTIENMLTNAVKYTPNGGGVTLNVTISNEILKCSVKDTGCGIPKSEQGKIFGKMYRASNVRNTVDGNGFGLYVAKGAIEAQGGKMWFESEEGIGTTFYITLPLKSA